MNALQVAEDYANEEGFEFTRSDDSIEIWHPSGAARVSEDGHVRADANHRLREVLERKIAQSRAQEIRLQEDPSARCTIKFSEAYAKMPFDAEDMMGEDLPTTLLAVFKVKRGQLSPDFLEWDTRFRSKPGNYPLPASPDYLILMLLTEERLWTTIRAAWPPEKEGWYRSHIGEIVEIRIEAA